MGGKGSESRDSEESGEEGVSHDLPAHSLCSTSLCREAEGEKQ